jgi:hypothetical protein
VARALTLIRIWVLHTPFLRVGLLTMIHAMAARSRSKPIGENQLDEAGNPVGIKSLIADFVLSVLLPGMVALVRPDGEPASEDAGLRRPPLQKKGEDGRRER